MAEEEKDVCSQTSEVQDEGGGDALNPKRSVEVKAFNKPPLDYGSQLQKTVQDVVNSKRRAGYKRGKGKKPTKGVKKVRRTLGPLMHSFSSKGKKGADSTDEFAAGLLALGVVGAVAYILLQNN